MESFVNQFVTNDGQVINYHVTRARTPRRVPANDRHSWSNKTPRGSSATCKHCGAEKKHQYETYTTVYRAAGATTWVADRPACKRPPAEPAPPARET